MNISSSWKSAEAAKASYYDVPSDAEELQLRAPKSPLSIERAGGHGGALVLLLDSAEAWIRPRFHEIETPASRLELGLQPDADLLYGHKLHFYATALADRFTAVTGMQLASVRVTKRHSKFTSLAIGSAIPKKPPNDTVEASLIVRHSYAKPDFAEAIREKTQCIRDIAAGNAALRLNLSYVTGFPRTWSRLWEPTIAGIFVAVAGKGTILDSSQIVELGLDHCSVGARIRHLVVLNISASRVRLDTV